MNNSIQPTPILVTGGSGFIGSEVVRQLIHETHHKVINLDCLTYAAHPEALKDIADCERYTFYKANVRNQEQLQNVFRKHQPTTVIHLAAETHVDRSINSADVFVQTNVVGTYNLLEVACQYWNQLDDEGKASFRFHHVSTDEVYGSIEAPNVASESSPYAPRSPYAASKASSDHLVKAWHTTYGLPVTITNGSNTYGPYQYTEKLIPVVILNALNETPIPIYGTGTNIRDWIHVSDHAHAIREVATHGRNGQSYNIASAYDRTNIELVTMICDTLDQLSPRANNERYRNLIQFVSDRPGHDQRYALNCGKVRQELNWAPQISLEIGLKQTITWFVRHIQSSNHD